MCGLLELILVQGLLDGGTAIAFDSYVNIVKDINEVSASLSKFQDCYATAHTIVAL